VQKTFQNKEMPETKGRRAIVRVQKEKSTKRLKKKKPIPATKKTMVVQETVERK